MAPAKNKHARTIYALLEDACMAGIPSRIHLEKKWMTSAQSVCIFGLLIYFQINTLKASHDKNECLHQTSINYILYIKESS